MQDWNDRLEDSVKRAAYHVYDNCRGMTHEDWEDMCSEGRLACIRWMRANPDQIMGPGLARLFTINAARDFERVSRRHRTCEELPPGVTTDPWSEDSCSEGQTCQPDQEYEAILGDILGKIVNDEREAMCALLVVYEGLTVREAAEHLGVPRSTVQDMMDRLRQRAADLGVTA